MGQSYRVRTGTGINKQITVQLDQEFEFLEILSLRIQQEEIYTRNCANYGVIVGRVTANNGFGLPNARVSVFIPITSVDESNPIISSIYPYKSTTDKNEDGYRYNLLPYEKSYSKHAATGTFPTRDDVLTGKTAVEIYDTYYKYTTKTNESGDYMIMGAPLGPQTLFMDVDLSDIGEFSLTPQDLIRMGLATESQVAGNQFKTSNDLNSLPQIISLTKTLEVSPLWGDETICQIAINRVDFDLRDEANVDIQPTAVFMGSMFSAPDKFRVRKNCKPKDNLGNLCNLEAGPGQILAIRQTIQQDNEGNPILEQYQIEQAGNIIDGEGTWLTEIPMNLDYVTTNEFGEKVISYDPTIGIPTKSKYRFKVKWQQSQTLSESSRRAYYLVPNVREFGWSNDDGLNDPNYLAETDINKIRQKSSYYFGLSWSGYANGIVGTTSVNDRIAEIVNCEDTFYQFEFNKVYTVSSLIDQYKKGARGRFIGIKEIDDDSCSSNVNKFPVNDGFRNFDLLFFIFSLLLQLLQGFGIIILIITHFLFFLYNLFISIILAICQISIFGLHPFGFICSKFGITSNSLTKPISLPMITYPECSACDCKTEVTLTPNPESNTPTGALSYLSFPDYYVVSLQTYFQSQPADDIQYLAEAYSQSLAGNASLISNVNSYKLPKSSVQKLPSQNYNFFTYSTDLPLGERINLFNQRTNFFNGLNRITVTLAKDSNFGKYHYDNTLTLLSNIQYQSGELLTFVNPTTSKDPNFNYSASTPTGKIYGISGTSYNDSNPTVINVTYATTQTTDTVVSYNLPYGSTIQNYQFPQDREYFQVLTAITISDAIKIWDTSINQSFPNELVSLTTIKSYTQGVAFWTKTSTEISFNPLENFTNYENQYILILQRGVDPYSPLYNNEYGVGKIFGHSNESDIKFTASTRVNIPIQKLNNTSISVQPFTSQNEIFYQSYFFNPGIVGNTNYGYSYTAFTTSDIGYYGSIDSSNPVQDTQVTNGFVYSNTANDFYDSNINSAKYDSSEDLSSMGYMYCNFNNSPYLASYDDALYTYYSYAYFFNFLNITFKMSINDGQKNIMRTDRLPTSDQLDGYDWLINPSILQQNVRFGIYSISTNGGTISANSNTTGASQATPDLEGQPLADNVLATFNCESMVGLDCYSGNGYSFGVSTSCSKSDAVENGCYLFVRKPLIDLFNFKDIPNFTEWGFRFRFFYGLCRGVLSQSFMNNWVNGTLFAFPIQVDTYFDSQNQPYSNYCRDTIFYDKDTTNFYYRSSPYNVTTKRFIGKNTQYIPGAINKRNLLFPTTIINLGPKDSFYDEVTFEPSNKGYIMNSLSPTSYGDTSDLVNLFVTTRITDEGFLSQLFKLGNNSLNQLFSRDPDSSGLRDAKRIDGDLAQAMSINSELGVIKFSQEYYETLPNNFAPIAVIGSAKNPTMGVFFSSTTTDLQIKDFVTPGRIDFRDNNNGFFPYSYGIKTQVVPFYQWRLDQTNPIFGNEQNNWSTDLDGTQGIYGYGYQNLDRLGGSSLKYFMSNSVPSNIDTYNRGYIFSYSGDSPSNYGYSLEGTKSRNFLVGAPFHFYFGLIKGQTALDKFKTKYSIVE